jgi:transposase
LEKIGKINAARYVQTLNKFRRALSEKRPKKKNVILQNGKARPPTSRLTFETIKNNGWKLLYPPYSLDLAP